MSISSRFLSLQPSYYIDLNEGHHEQVLYDHHQVIHHHMTPFSFTSLQPHSSSASSLSSSSSSSSPIYLNPAQDQAGICFMGSQVQPYPYQQEVENLSSYESGSFDQTTLEISKRANDGLKFSICKKDDHKNLGGGYGGDSGGGASEINGSSVKWMSSKMRLMKKMMKTEEDQKADVDTGVANALANRSSNNGSNNNNNNESATIRVCSDCNTSKTPLWRSGPRGPKSLCNACGIRQRKARRAMAAAAAAGNGSVLPNNPSNSMIRAGNIHKKASTINNSNNNNGIGAQKKRSKMFKLARDQHHNKTSQRKLCFEEFALSLSKKLSLPKVFPQEEKEAAILLMALSCGLVHG